jgi:hypothetical protein
MCRDWITDTSGSDMSEACPELACCTSDTGTQKQVGMVTIKKRSPYSILRH